MKNKKTTIIGMTVVILLAILTVYVMISQSKTFNFQNFINLLSNAWWPWIVLAVFGMVGFIYFEGLAIVLIARVFGFRKRKRKSFMYAAPDVYFSAITPSATGGQPASAFFMIKDGITAASATMTLLINLIFYTMSIVVIGLACFIISPGVIGHFDWLSYIMITVGFVLQFIMIAVFLLLVYKSVIVKKAASIILHFFKKIHLIKHLDKKLKKLDKMEVEYKQCASVIKFNKKKLGVAFLCNMAQRISQILVSVFVFIGIEKNFSKILDVFATQGFVAIGSNSVPIPGAVGAADYLFVDGFADLCSDPVSIELVSRGISFYVCVIVSGLITVGSYIFLRMRAKKKKQKRK